jgi:hypothetical protein
MPCWATFSALPGPSTSATFSMHGSAAVHCSLGGVLMPVRFEQEDPPWASGCGLLQHGPMNRTIHGVVDDALADGTILGLVKEGGSSVLTIPFTVRCKLDVPMAQVSCARPRSCIAYVTIAAAADDPLTLRAPLEHASAAAPPADSPMLRSGQRRPCRIRACSKVYGNGGMLATPAYLHFWAQHFRDLGVSEVVLYALEPLPASLMAQLEAEADIIRVRQWGSRRFSEQQLAAQQKNYSSEIESFFMSSISHCAQEKQARTCPTRTRVAHCLTSHGERSRVRSCRAGQPQRPLRFCVLPRR